MEKTNTRLLAFTKFYWPEGGGAELATHLILNILSKYFRILVVSGTLPSKAAISYKISKYVHWEALRHNYKPIELFSLLSTNVAIRNSIEEADAIYVHTPLPIAILAKKVRPDVKVIVHLHNYQPISYSSVVFHDENFGYDVARSVKLELLENKSLSRALLSGILSWTNIFNRIALSYADKIICISRKQAEILTHRLNEVKDKVTVIHNPLPTYRQNGKPHIEKPTMLYLGGESYIKGFHLILQALSKSLFKPFDDNLKVICAGEFARLTRHHLRIPALDIIGRVNHETVLGLCCNARAVLVPSIVEEPLPYAVVEAMATGTIPLASRVGGIPEIVQGTYAEETLFTPGDLNEFSDRAKEVLSLSKEELVEIGETLRHGIAEKFDRETIRSDLLDAFGPSKGSYL